ncbi:class I SAM-dependent methyltransferase [Candidatus Parcubacteria bacterium]|nr:class I SAM-dependent methyltransferase [Patescibacteria group bacterium]MCG2699754.1 class I SAM-dependent methyltransferase [Candidatus Parcubacteria bacterium]
MKKINDKYKRELNFWINKWEEKMQKDWWSDDVPTLLRINNNPNIYSYQQRKKQEAKALFLRFLKETEISDKSFLKNKIVVDIGPGPMGLLEASNAKIKIAIDPIAQEYQKHNLLLKDSDVVYINLPAEKIPLLDGYADVVISRNSLDHVSDPIKVVKEIYRILRTNGYFVLNVDINHPSTIAEPHKITQSMIKKITQDFELIRKIIYNKPHGWKGKMYVGLFKKVNK